MERTFIELPEFIKDWKELGLGEDELFDLETYLLKNPDAAPVVRGTGGVRKLRWATKGKGKSGGARVIYVDFVMKREIFFLAVYSKKVKEAMTDQECADLKRLVKRLLREGA